MSKLKRSLAIGSAAALVAAGLGVSAPAAYAVGEVTLAPTSGTNLGTFNTDDFSLTATVVTAAVSANTLTYKITDPDQGKWYVKIGNIDDTVTAVTAATAARFEAHDSLGNNVEMNTATNATFISLDVIDDGTTNGFADAVDPAGNADEKLGEFTVDFTALGATTLFIQLASSQLGASNALVMSPFEGTVTAEANVPAGGIDVLVGGAVQGNLNELDYGDGDASASVQAWIDLDADIDDVEALYASTEKTVTWYDPKTTGIIPAWERFQTANAVYLNDYTTDGKGGATLRFTNPVNLDQIDLSKFEYNVTNSVGNVIANTAFVDGDAVIPVGFTERDDQNRLFLDIKDADNTAFEFTAAEGTVTLKVKQTGGVQFGSVGYVPPTSANADANLITATVNEEDDTIQANELTQGITARAGVKALSFTSQIKKTDVLDEEAASVPVLAKVTAGSTYLSTGGGLTVSGSPASITKAGQTVFTQGFTNAKGQWTVTVTSANADKDEDYTVTFYVLDGTDDNWNNILDLGADDAEGGAAANADVTGAYTVTYNPATATTLSPDATILSGASVTASFTLLDQFGTAINKTAAGKAVSVELKAANAANLDEDAAVAEDGTVSFTFDNYVVAGASDLITATSYTGTALAATPLGGAGTQTLTLYNAVAATAVQAPATITGVITYDDFLADGLKNTTAVPAPNDGTMSVTVTVVDANGVGIPASPVTLAADGFQFLGDGSKYYNDTVTVVSDAAGVATVSFWAHTVNTTGATMTITSGGVSTTSKVKTYLPENVSGGNLVFSLDVPENVVMNTTYALVASLKDKWGNPIKTAANGNDNGVVFQGNGSVQINSSNLAVEKNFGADGTSTVFVRSIKDIAGPGSVTASLEAASYTFWNGAATATDQLIITEVTTDVVTTAFDETSFKNSLESDVEVTETAPAATPSADQKVNAGSFKGYVALYAKGYAGKRMSAKVGKDWVVVESLASNFERVVEYTGAGYTVAVRIYIDRVLIDTITVTTK